MNSNAGPAVNWLRTLNVHNNNITHLTMRLRTLHAIVYK